MSGKLIVIPTPIGNLDDVTVRTLNVFKSLDLLLCEDSRVTGKLLKHYDIRVPLRPYHAHNEHKTYERIAESIKQGSQVGLVTDAGMPGLSDPGFLLIREVIRQDIHLEVLPGANAALPALILSGLPSDRFHFEGFLPHKKGRQTRWKYLAELPNTFILYESPHRIIKCLKELMEFCGPDRGVAVCRELTKLYEEVLRGPAHEVHKILEDRDSIKGEIVLVVSGNQNT